MTNGISLLGQNQANANRLLTLGKTMNDLQRQATTQKKYETLSGFGNDSQRILRYRMDVDSLNTYSNNIDIAASRMDLMSNALTQGRGLGEQLISTINGELLGGVVDIQSIKTVAKSALDFMQTLVNTEIDGRYLFSGSATSTPPLTNRAQINTLMQSEITNWLNGSITTAQLTSDLSTITDTQIGLDPALSTAGPVSVRVDDQVEVDYDVLGNQNGFDKLMKAMAMAAALDIPDPATDVPNLDDLATVLQSIQSLAREGMEEITAANTKIATKYSVLDEIKTRQIDEKAVLQKALDTSENADTTEVLIQLQFLQNQLSASYQVTNIVSQLSLVNYLS